MNHPRTPSEDQAIPVQAGKVPPFCPNPGFSERAQAAARTAAAFMKIQPEEACALVDTWNFRLLV